MKKKSILTVLTAVLAVAFIFSACKKENETDSKNPVQKSSTAINYCGEPTTVALIAGQNINVGSVIVGNDDDNLYITYATTGGWEMSHIHLYVGTEEGLPEHMSPGHMTYNEDLENGTTEYTVTMPKEDLNGLECVTIAAHAIVKDNVGKGGTQTAWGEGRKTGDNWSMIFDYCLQDCPEIYPVCFNKVKFYGEGVEENSASEGEFTFDLYQIDEMGNTEFLESISTDPYGVVCANLYPGSYKFTEQNHPQWQLTIPAIYFNLLPNGEIEWLNGFTGKAVNERKLGPAYGSVTATWDINGYLKRITDSLDPKNGNPKFPTSYLAGVVYNSNHFTYAKYTRSQLEAGVEMAMVVGNKYDYVGKATAQIVGNNIEVTIHNFGKGDFGVIAFNKPMTDKMPKNGNIHSQKEADLINELGATTGFNHDNKTVVPCPSGNDIYLYIHCGTIQYYLDVQ